MKQAVNRHRIPGKSLLLLLIVALGVSLLTGCGAKVTAEATEAASAPTEAVTETVQVSPLDTLEFTLPHDITLRRDSDSRETFVTGPVEVGGVFLLDCEEEVLENVLNQEPLIDLVLSAMKGETGEEWESHSGGSSLYGLLELNMGNGQGKSYKAYVVRGYSACYIFWFDQDRISSDSEIAVMESLRSNDITEELNRISTQAYADAIAESMAQEEYTFEVTLPAGMEKQSQTEDSALFYQDGQMVGGYKIIHFEKGILPNVHENQELILERLKEYTAEQVDLTDFTGEIIDESLITARFTNGGTEYTHYILTYGQVGTQYDIWFDESKVSQTVITQILSAAQLTQVD